MSGFWGKLQDDSFDVDDELVTVDGFGGGEVRMEPRRSTVRLAVDAERRMTKVGMTKAERGHGSFWF